MEKKLVPGDKLADDSLLILEEDSLCFVVESVSNGAKGVRTISKKLLGEWVSAYKMNPSMPAETVRNLLKGKSEIDRYEYGYAGTLAKMAKMILGYIDVEHIELGNGSRDEENLGHKTARSYEITSGTAIAIGEQEKVNLEKFGDFINEFHSAAKSAGLTYEENLVKRFVCALLAKPFVVLTGLSGSGKTKLAEAFTRWMAHKDTRQIVSVGADWVNNEKLLGYPNALDPTDYIMPDTGVLRLLLDANDNPDIPFFLVLDEMNLSHVERYFADFLSVMESKDDIKLHGDEMRTAKDGARIPPAIKFPKNLFVIGTMNVDETTHMFSPKVLDRAQVIEFRVSAEQMGAFLDSPSDIDMLKIEGKGLKYAEGFKKLKDGSCALEKEDNKKVADTFKDFFPQLAELGFEFAFRTAREAMVFCAFAVKAGLGIDAAIDAAIMQKLLPKLHGSRRRLAQALEKFWEFCRKSGNTETIADLFKKGSTIKVVNVTKYPISAEKIRRMYKAVEANGFASYAEA